MKKIIAVMLAFVAFSWMGTAQALQVDFLTNISEIEVLTGEIAGGFPFADYSETWINLWVNNDSTEAVTLSLQSASAGALEDLFLMLVVPQDISVPPLTAVEIPFLVTAPIKYSFSVGDYIPAEVGDFSTLVTLNYYYSINGVSDFFSRTGQTITVVEPNSGGTAPVPEPATMLLFATGLAGLAAVGRRRRKQ